MDARELVVLGLRLFLFEYFYQVIYARSLLRRDVPSTDNFLSTKGYLLFKHASDRRVIFAVLYQGNIWASSTQYIYT